MSKEFSLTKSWNGEKINNPAATVNFTSSDFSPYTHQSDKMIVKQLGHMEDIRKPRAANQTSDEILQNLINVILNARKDITRIDGLDDYETAKNYASKHNLRISKEETDINHDGVNDVILYNKQGKPVIVNGYRMTPSKQPLRKLYQKAKREGNLIAPSLGMNGYIKQLYIADPEFNENGERDVEFSNNNLPPELKDLKLQRWSIPSAPKSKLSPHQFIMKLIRDTYNTEYRDKRFIAKNKSWINGALPRFKIFELVYMHMIERELWASIPKESRNNILAQAGGNPDYAYRLYKEFKESNRANIRKVLIDNMEATKTFDFKRGVEAIVSNMGITEEWLNNESKYTDDDFKKYDRSDSETEIFKNKLKEEWNSDAEGMKNFLIQDIFVPIPEAKK